MIRTHCFYATIAATVLVLGGCDRSQPTPTSQLATQNTPSESAVANGIVSVAEIHVPLLASVANQEGKWDEVMLKLLEEMDRNTRIPGQEDKLEHPRCLELVRKWQPERQEIVAKCISLIQEHKCRVGIRLYAAELRSAEGSPGHGQVSPAPPRCPESGATAWISHEDGPSDALLCYCPTVHSTGYRAIITRQLSYYCVSSECFARIRKSGRLEGAIAKATRLIAERRTVNGRHLLRISGIVMPPNELADARICVRLRAIALWSDHSAPIAKITHIDTLSTHEEPFELEGELSRPDAPTAIRVLLWDKLGNVESSEDIDTIVNR